MYPYHYERIRDDARMKISDWHDKARQIALVKAAQTESRKALPAKRPMRRKIGLVLIHLGGRLAGEQY